MKHSEIQGHLNWLFFLFLLPFSAVYGEANLSNIDMFVGEVRVIENISAERVAVGSGSVLTVKTLPRQQILLIAENEGSSSLHLWRKDGTEISFNVRVSKADPQIRVRLEDMIYMDVKIVEFRKNALSEVGVDWQRSIDGPTFATAGDLVSTPLFRPIPDNDLFTNASLPNNIKPFQSYFGITTEITSRLNYLASNGDARTLAEPKLSIRNGGMAKFLAGGEIPIPIRGENGEVTVDYRDYGIKLEIESVADQSGIIASKILAEVSTLDQSIDVMGAPGFLTRRTETEMNVKESETIVISGLLSGEVTKDVDKVPLLGDIPILGNLFKSSKFRNQLTELVVFVTPKIFRVDSDINKERLKRGETIRNEALGTLNKKLKFGIVD